MKNQQQQQLEQQLESCEYGTPEYRKVLREYSDFMRWTYPKNHPTEISQVDVVENAFFSCRDLAAAQTLSPAIMRIGRSKDRRLINAELAVQRAAWKASVAAFHGAFEGSVEEWRAYVSYIHAKNIVLYLKHVRPEE